MTPKKPKSKIAPKGLAELDAAWFPVWSASGKVTFVTPKNRRKPHFAHKAPQSPYTASNTPTSR